MFKVLYFGVYDPDYSRNWVLINGLRKNGVEVEELRQKPARGAWLKLIWGYLKLKKDFTAVVVGFPGQEMMFLARWLFRKKPIVFDAFTSHYGGYILDRKRWGEKSWRARCFRWLDYWSCRLAKIVLLDTQAHIDFFVKEFKLPPEKFRRIWIGANDDLFKAEKNTSAAEGVFRVIFFGTYVPLQGAEQIVQAAKILEKDQEIVFYFIGRGQDRNKAFNLARELGLKNIIFKDMLEPVKLRVEIGQADVALGLFGQTPKTPLVIPNKIYEALAMGKAVITADTPAIRELFSEKEMVLVKAGNPRAIAEAILELKSNPTRRRQLAENGQRKFQQFAASSVLGRQLKEILTSLS